MTVVEELLLRDKEVARMIGVSRSTLWRLVRADLFPPPIRVGTRAVRWRLSEVLEWIASRPVATA